jgi:hypothetical protein
MGHRSFRFRMIATLTSITLATSAGCNAEVADTEHDDDTPEAYRAGPNPAALAVEVDQLRGQPVVLSPTSPVRFDVAIDRWKTTNESWRQSLARSGMHSSRLTRGTHEQGHRPPAPRYR